VFGFLFLGFWVCGVSGRERVQGEGCRCGFTCIVTFGILSYLNLAEGGVIQDVNVDLVVRGVPRS